MKVGEKLKQHRIKAHNLKSQKFELQEILGSFNGFMIEFQTNKQPEIELAIKQSMYQILLEGMTERKAALKEVKEVVEKVVKEKHALDKYSEVPTLEALQVVSLLMKDAALISEQREFFDQVAAKVSKDDQVAGLLLEKLNGGMNVLSD